MESKYVKGIEIDKMIDEPCRSCEYSQTSPSCEPCSECIVLHEFNSGVGAFPVL